MRPSDWNWLLTIAGTVASVAGVVFSWMAWVQATKAKEAAREAAAAVRKRETAYEVSRLARDAKDFLTSVQQKRREIAILTSNNLAHALTTIRSWRIAHSSDLNTLRACVRDIEGVAIRLTVEGIPVEGPGFESLLFQCHGIHRTVCDMAGRLEHLSEESPYEHPL